MQFLIGLALAVGVIAFLFLFAAFINWRDNRDMADAAEHIHYVQRGVYDSPTTKVVW
jgi:hypothetical protein